MPPATSKAGRPLPTPYTDEESNTLWDVEQAAHYMSISVPHLYRLAQQKRITFVRLGSALRFDPEDVKDYIKSRKVKVVAK